MLSGLFVMSRNTATCRDNQFGRCHPYYLYCSTTFSWDGDLIS